MHNNIQSDPAAYAQRLAATEFNHAWGITQPAALDDRRATPFHEAMRGLVMREVHEPEVFRLFFG